MKGKSKKEDMLVNEAEIVEQAKKNNQAFEILYDFYFPKIYRYIFKRVGSFDIAEDLVSNTFLNVFANLHKYEYKGHSFGAWVYRIATNNLIDYYRKSARRKKVNIDSIPELKDENSGSDALNQRIQNREIVQQVLKELPIRYQKVLDLKFFAEKTNSEIAKILETSENNVRVLIFRALKRFKKEYKKHER